MKMPGMTIRHASAMPAPTWSWLKMNDVTIQLPDDLERNCQVEIEAGDTLDNTTSFEGSVAALQERIDSARTDKPADERATVTAATGADRGAEELDIPALSTYEHRAVLSEVACDIANDFETGVGADMRAYLNFLAGGTAVLATEEGEEAEATIRITTHEGVASGASIDIVAAPNSTFSIALSLDSAANTPAFMGSTMRVFAGAGARVDITVYLTASDAVTCVEDSGFVLDEGARVNVRHVVLGGGFTATGLAADLRGDRSRIDVDTSYLASGTQQRDFNYIIRHRGRKTVSNMDANGVLTGTSKKCLRGTIDLIHGAKGAEGNERETCCWRARASTTRLSRTSCAMRMTLRATTERPSATCVPSSSSTQPAAASPRSRPRPCSFPQSSRTPHCRRPTTPCAPTSCASATRSSRILRRRSRDRHRERDVRHLHGSV